MRFGMLVDFRNPLGSGFTDSEIYRETLDNVVYAPTGFFLQYQAWRKNVSGIVKGPLPFFWGVSKTV